jgi:hypothetical protein
MARQIKTISNFKSKLAGGAARPNLFEVEIPNFPDAISTTYWDGETKDKFTFMAKAAALPASNVAQIEIPFRGRVLKVAGDRTFDVWTVTIINDEDFRIRTAMEQWMNMLSKLDDATGATSPSSYMVDAYVHQLGRGIEKFSTNHGEGTTEQVPLRTYKFFDIFPTNIGQIDLSYESTDTPEEFTVDFQVQYWTAGTGSQGEGDQTNVRMS